MNWQRQDIDMSASVLELSIGSPYSCLHSHISILCYGQRPPCPLRKACRYIEIPIEPFHFSFLWILSLLMFSSLILTKFSPSTYQLYTLFGDHFVDFESSR